MRDKAERQDERTLKKQVITMLDGTRDALKSGSRRNHIQRPKKTNVFEKDSFWRECRRENTEFTQVYLNLLNKNIKYT